MSVLSCSKREAISLLTTAQFSAAELGEDLLISVAVLRGNYKSTLPLDDHGAGLIEKYIEVAPSVI